MLKIHPRPRVRPDAEVTIGINIASSPARDRLTKHKFREAVLGAALLAAIGSGTTAMPHHEARSCRYLIGASQ
jgi:hypothetical protein